MLMALKGASPNLLGRSKGAISGASSGCDVALLIAYQHLKSRFTAQKAEIKELRSVKMKSEEEEGYSSSQILERKVEQLQKSLQSKITAYNNLEATYKQTRENEESLLNHTTETEQMLFELMGKCQTYQKEIDDLTTRVNELDSENCKLKEELLEKKSIPEVEVLTSATTNGIDAPRSTDKDELTKQIKALLYENKTLKTNMYWLTTELKNAKSKEGISPRRRVRHDSGGLEEGRAYQLSANEDGTSDICKCMKNIVLYVRKMERTISTLKTALDKNNIVINDLLLKKYGHIPKILRRNDSLGCCKLTESYVTINGEENLVPKSKTTHVGSWDSQDEETLPELESASVIVPLEELSSDEEDLKYLKSDIDDDLHTGTCLHQNLIEEVDCSGSAGLYPNIRRGSLNYLQESESEACKIDDGNSPGDHESNLLNESFGDGALRNINCPCNLPLLIQNLELQRTKTYLTTKKSNEGKNVYNNQGSKINSPVGSPCHGENTNVLELFDRKSSRKICPVEINT